MENGTSEIFPTASRTFEVSIVTYYSGELITGLLDYKGASEDDEDDFCWEFRSSKKPYSPLEGVSIKYAGDLIFEAEGDLSGIVIIVELASNITAGLFAAWLYNKLKKNKAKRLTIEKREIDIEEGEIKRVVESIITLENE